MGARGWRGRAHLEARPLQAPRWISATLCRPRYRASEASALLRALNQPEAMPALQQSPPAFKEARSRARRSPPVVLRCERRDRERSAEAQARAAVCLEPYTCVTDAINLQPRGVDAG